MFSRLHLIWIIVLLALQPLTSVAQYQVTPNCLSVWEAIIDLRYNDADSIIKQELQENPTNYYAHYLAQTADAFQFMINMSDSAYEAVNEGFETRMDIMEDKDSESPYYYACIAEMQLQVGMFNIIYGDRLTGLRRAYSAYKKTYRNIEKFPDFKQSYKLDGIFNVAISNMPPFVGWAVKFFGVNGSYIDGYEIIRSYYESSINTRGINAEAALYNVLAFKLNKDNPTACEFIGELPDSILSYKLIQYFNANVAYHTSRNELALDLIKQIPFESNGCYFNGYNYLMGKILVRKLDTSARNYLKTYLRNQNGLQYVKKANYLLALSYLVDGDNSMYEHYIEISQDYGAEVTERDRETVYDYELDYDPLPVLEKANLLIDGGYKDRAITAMNNVDMQVITNFTPYNLQYLFLKGKLSLLKEDTISSKYYFNEVILKGEDQDYLYASHSALYLGLINENTDIEGSYLYFEKAVDLWKSGYYEFIKFIAENKMEMIENRDGRGVE